MTVRTMYDAIGVNAQKVRAVWKPGDLVGFYIAGNSYIWSAADRALFPPDALVSITLTVAFLAADVLDVEPGGADPAQTGAWIAAKKAAGYARPTIYCSRSVIPAVRTGTGSYILGVDYDIWCADWTGAPHQVTAPGLPPATCAATQYQNLPGAGYDLSVIYDDGWPHRTPPSPAPTPTKAAALAAAATLTAYVEATA